MSKKRKILVRVLTSLAMVAIVLPAYFIEDGSLLKWLFVSLTFLVIIEMITMADGDDLVGRIDAAAWIGFVFCILAAADCYLIICQQIPRELIGFAMAVTVTTDACAWGVGNLIGGKIYGKHPFPRISPNKTWEGTLGGIGFGMASVLLWSQVFNMANTSPGFALASFCVPVIATAGDLAESALKRACHVKDSNDRISKFFKPFGVILGGRDGHGGYFDRMDSLIPALFVMIFAYIWTTH